MKYLLVCNFFFWFSLSVTAQTGGVDVKIIFVDSLVKNKKSHESGWRIVIKNNTNNDIFIPDLMTHFYAQISDSIFFSTQKNGIYNLSSKRSGAPTPKKGSRAFPFNGSTEYLLGKYYEQFSKKKRFSDSIITYLNLGSKGNFNPIFLKKNEQFIIYQMSPAHLLFMTPGNYKIDFKFTARKENDLPSVINGYRKYVLGEISAKPVYVSSEKTKKNIKVLIKDAEQKVMRSFVWRM